MDYIKSIRCIKSIVDTVSRHFLTSAINVTQLYPPLHVKLKVLPIRFMSKSMNIEYLEIMGMILISTWSWSNLFFNFKKKSCRKVKKVIERKLRFWEIYLFWKHQFQPYVGILGGALVCDNSPYQFISGASIKDFILERTQTKCVCVLSYVAIATKYRCIDMLRLGVCC